MAAKKKMIFDQSSAPKKTINTPEPPPEDNGGPAAWDLVIKRTAELELGGEPIFLAMRNRDNGGQRKYGVRLRPGNGRSHLIDATQEAFDLCAYLACDALEGSDESLLMLDDAIKIASRLYARYTA